MTRGRRLAAGALLGGLLLALFFRGVDWGAVGQAFRTADPWYLTGLVAATLLTYVFRAWRWGYLLAPLARVPFPRLLSITLLGFAAGLVVPRAGEVLRPYLVARHHSLRTSAAFASIILERLLDLITVLCLFGLYLYALPLPPQQQRGPLLGVLKAAGALAGLAALGVLALLLALQFSAARVLAVADRVLARLPRVGAPVGRALRAFAEGLAVLRSPVGHLLAIAGQSLLVWGSIAIGIYWNNRAFGLELPFHTAFLIIGFLTVGVAIPTPGMVGGFHEAYLLSLTQAFGVAHATAAAAGIACHALTNLPVLALGVLCLWREGLSFGRVAQMTEGNGGGDGEAQGYAAGSEAGSLRPRAGQRT